MIFVTGGTGLVGAHLLYKLAKKGLHVRALRRESSNLTQVLKTFAYYCDDPKTLFDKIEWVNGDILDYFSLEKCLDGVSEIYHCAAIVSFDKKERSRMIANNVEGTANLVNAALEKGIGKLCHVSSVAALGKASNGEMVTEETNWIPSRKNSGYSESKFFSEAEIWRGIEEGLDSVIVNPSIIIGPANWENGSAKLFGTAWEGMKFYTKGITGYVGVDDVVEAMITLMDQSIFETTKNQRYLLNAENLDYQQVFNAIADALGRPRPSIKVSPWMLGLVWRMFALAALFTGKTPLITKETATTSIEINRFDGSKITRTIELQYTPIKDSIERTAGFFRKDQKEAPNSK